jgi:hypothetical protein
MPLSHILLGPPPHYMRFLGSQEVGTETYIGEDKAKLISVDTNDAGNRLKIHRDQQLLGVPG